MKSSKAVQKHFDLWMLLVNTKDAIHQVREKELEPFDISPQQSGILATIMALQNNATPADISRLTFRKANTVTITLDRMAKKGLITKRKDSEKKNVIRVSLTDMGRRIYEHTTRRESIHEVMSGLSDEECEKLKSYLETLMERSRLEIGIKKIQRPQF